RRRHTRFSRDWSSDVCSSDLNRTKHRTVTDRAALYEVLDAGLICHLGIVLDSSPVVLPTSYGREGDLLYLHGSTGARSLRAASRSEERRVGKERRSRSAPDSC